MGSPQRAGVHAGPLGRNNAARRSAGDAPRIDDKRTIHHTQYRCMDA
jgi:hypothetical protein